VDAEGARRIAELPALAGARGVDVLGVGEGAQLLRAAFAGPSPGMRPTVVIDTTGDPATIAGALARVADLGTVVLAGEQPEPIDLDAYVDLHSRGLVVIAWSDAGTRP
jgi:hypothetical protein